MRYYGISWSSAFPFPPPRIWGPSVCVNYQAQKGTDLPDIEIPQKWQVQGTLAPFPPLSASADMDHHPQLYAEMIFAGTAELEDGYIRGATAGDCGKETLIPVVEVLDKVRDVFPLCARY